MKALARATPILLLISVLGQQTPPARQEVPEEAKCRIEGHVLRVSGEPLKKARIILQGEGRDKTFGGFSDPAGKFELKEIPPGRFRMYVERQGYVRQEYGQRSQHRQGSALTLSPGTKMRDLVFKLVPAGVVTGRVFDEDGEPLENIQIELLQYSYSQGRRQLLPAGGATTNDLGEYRIFGLEPGRYFLRATYNPGVHDMGSGVTVTNPHPGMGQTYPTVYYPGTPDPARAVALELGPGEEQRGIDFAFLPARAYRVRGQVLNAVTGRPGTGAVLMLMPKEANLPFFFMGGQGQAEASQGSFEIRNVLPGAYVLHAHWEDEGKTYSGRVPVNVVEGDLEGVMVTIVPGTEVTGTVVDESGKLTLSELSVYLEPQSEAMIFGGASGRVKKDGKFTIENVGEDVLDVGLAPLPEGCYVKAIRFGTQDALENGLTVAKGKSSAPLEIVVGGPGGRIDGQVTNSEELPVSGAQVVLVPEPKHRHRLSFYKTASTDQFGRFSVNGIRPGEYKLFAWEEIEPGIFQDPEFLQKHESKGKPVQVRESSTQTAELKVIPANPAGH